MNEIFIVFADYPEVISAVNRFHQELKLPHRTDDNILTLIKAMAKASDVPIDNLNDDFIVRPFAPGSGAGRRQP